MIYVNGDSYLTPNDELGHFTVENYLKKFVGDSNVVNRSVPGSSNARILRSSLRDLIEARQSSENILAIVGLTFLHRADVWDTSTVGSQFDPQDGLFRSIQYAKATDWYERLINTAQTSKLGEFLRLRLHFTHPESEMTHILQGLVALTEFCDRHKIKYIIFFSVPTDSVRMYDSHLTPFYELVNSKTGVLDLQEFSMNRLLVDNGYDGRETDIESVFAHPTNQGHQFFAKYLYDKFKGIYW